MPQPETFAIHRGEIKERFDPHFHRPYFKELLRLLSRRRFRRLGEIISQSSEVWDRSSGLHPVAFPYIEISAVGLGTNEYSIEVIAKKDAPSRARQIVRKDDILVSLTRPHRGAIAIVKTDHEQAIASTGFAVLRDLRLPSVDRNYLFNVLCTRICLDQFLQRSSGGNYPAITPDQLERVIIPVPDLKKQRVLLSTLESARSTRLSKLGQADELLKGLDDFLLERLGIRLPVASTKNIFAIRTSSIRDNSRANADFFHPERVLTLRAIASITQRLPFRTLSEIVTFEREQVKNPINNYVGLANVQSHTGQLVPANEEATGTCSVFKRNDILFARLRPYLNKVYRVERDGCCSTEFHVLRIRDSRELLPDYLAVLLRSNLVLSQTKHMMTGNTHPRLTNDDVIKLILPVPQRDVQEEIVSEVQRRAEESRRLRDVGEQKLVTAKKWFEEQLLKGSE